MHLMHASRFLTEATNPFISKTLVGQNSTQMWHPLQYFSMISIVGSFFSIHVAPLTKMPVQASANYGLITHTVYKLQVGVAGKNAVLKRFSQKGGKEGKT